MDVVLFLWYPRIQRGEPSKCPEIRERLSCCLTSFRFFFGRKIAFIKWAEFDHGLETEGAYKGRKYIRLRANNFDKTQKLSIAKPTIREVDQDIRTIPDNPEDPYCLYKTLLFFKDKYFPKTWSSYILLRPAYFKEVGMQEKKGRYPFLAGIYRKNKDGDYVVDENNPTGKLGEHYPNTLLKDLGKLCGFDARITSRSGRRTGATKVGGSGASASHQAMFTRHAADPVTGNSVLPLYQENSKASSNRVTASLLIQPSVLKETGQLFQPEVEEDGEDVVDEEEKKPSPEELAALKKKAKNKKKKDKKKAKKKAAQQQQMLMQQQFMQQQFMQQQQMLRMMPMMQMPMMGMPSMGMGMQVPMGQSFPSFTQASSSTDATSDTEES